MKKTHEEFKDPVRVGTVDQQITPQDTKAADILCSIKNTPEETTYFIKNMAYFAKEDCIMVLLEEYRPYSDKSSCWVTADEMCKKMPLLLAKFVVELLPHQLRKMEPQEPQHYRDSWCLGDKYDRPCDWGEQASKYNMKMNVYKANRRRYERTLQLCNNLSTWAGAYLTDPNMMRHQMNYRLMDTVKMYTTNCKDENNDDGYEFAYIDSGSDTFGIGGKAWVIDHITDRTVQVAEGIIQQILSNMMFQLEQASQLLTYQMMKQYW
jgi:hypothetical protein